MAEDDELNLGNCVGGDDRPEDARGRIKGREAAGKHVDEASTSLGAEDALEACKRARAAMGGVREGGNA